MSNETNEVARDDLKAQRDEMREKIAQVNIELLDAIRRLATQEPKQIARMACEAALGMAANDPNIFNLEAAERESIMRIYPDLPGLILSKLPIDGRGDFATVDCEFVKLTDWIAHHALFFDMPCWKFHNFNNAVSQFFDHHEEEFGHAVGSATQLIYNGIPLFKYDESSSQFTPISFANEDYVYLSKKGEHCDWQPRGSFPYWAKKYFFRREHLEAHGIFFGGVEVGEKPEKVATLREAFRRHIGFGASPQVDHQRAHRTKMMVLVDRVLDHFYGPNFDPKNDDTWPKKSMVLAWIKDTFSVSEADAKAIDAVTRPDAARNKR